VDKGICLRPCLKWATRNGALETDPRIWVDDLLIDHIVTGGHLDLIGLRVGGGHVVKKGRLLNEPLLAVFARVGEVLHMPLHVIVHGVLTCEALATILLLADKLTLGVLDVFHCHLVP